MEKTAAIHGYGGGFYGLSAGHADGAGDLGAADLDGQRGGPPADGLDGAVRGDGGDGAAAAGPGGGHGRTLHSELAGRLLKAHGDIERAVDRVDIGVIHALQLQLADIHAAGAGLVAVIGLGGRAVVVGRIGAVIRRVALILTVTVQVTDSPFTSAVMTALPLVSAVTSPAELTLATVGALLLQAAASSVPLTFSSSLSPTFSTRTVRFRR